MFFSNSHNVGSLPKIHILSNSFVRYESSEIVINFSYVEAKSDTN